ncbi:MAG: YkgJ family cysteine cluster protein [Verrucomicrobia bacterium]|nr:YkgJ family cysteine cluster protein [Verrucomicrobiota bacterium]
MPVFYECQRCTACCRWPGVVRLSDLEITRLASFHELTEFEFIQQYTRLATDRRGLVLNDNQNGECIFLKGEDCSVQPVKPQQCRDFPNLWNFPGFEKTCRAIPKILSAEEYQSALDRSRSATPPTPREVAPLPPTMGPTTLDTPASTDTTFKPFAAS